MCVFFRTPQSKEWICRYRLISHKMRSSQSFLGSNVPVIDPWACLISADVDTCPLNGAAPVVQRWGESPNSPSFLLLTQVKFKHLCFFLFLPLMRCAGCGDRHKYWQTDSMRALRVIISIWFTVDLLVWVSSNSIMWLCICFTWQQ